MPKDFEAPRGDLLDLLDELARTLEYFAETAENRSSLAIVLARTLGAEWIALRSRGGEWLEVRSRACREGQGAERVAHLLDFAVLAEVPRGRLVRLAGAALERRPRFTGSGIREIAIYVDRDSEGAAGLVAIALPRPLSIAPSLLESILRSWFALQTLRIRSRQAEESERMASIGRQAACALHDLRHELTVAGLELERASCGSDADPSASLDRVRASLAAARSICECSLVVDSAEEPEPCHVAGLLRREILAACAVAGRGDAVRIETRCRDDLVIRAHREALSRIVRNLVLNAVESSPDGERVVVEMEPESNGDFVLRVIDRGRGMSIADRGHFLRFGRSGRGGSGIGTASVEACARSLEASMRIESRLGFGTRAELRFPRTALQVEA